MENNEINKTASKGTKLNDRKNKRNNASKKL